MAANSPNSPRQKMINLMYLVFIAMLALNVSTEVLDGFALVEDSLDRTMKSTSTRNEMIFSDMAKYYEMNPTKAEKWYNYAQEVKNRSDSLFNFAKNLKLKIAQKTDGKEGDPSNLKRPDNLDAAYEVMFQHGINDGKKLRDAIDNYRGFVSSLITDTAKRNIVESNLSTELSRLAKENNQTWEESMFWKMPAIASVTLLTKLQNDIRYAEGEVLSDLLRNVDVLDYRVNKIEAQVIPQSQIVMKGSSYTADLVLSAVDSTQQPTIFVNGKILPPENKGRFVVGTGSTGTFPVAGYIETNSGTGNVLRREFKTQYSVVEPSATVASLLMNVLYPGIENEMEIAVPGVPSNNVTATMTNGTLTRKNNEIWVARPTKAGTEAVVSIQAKMTDGRVTEMKKTFKVRPLPRPTAFLMVADAKGNPEKFEGGGRALPKATLLNTPGINVAIDDGLLNIPFTVLRFEVVVTDNMGMDSKEFSQSASFTEGQKTMMRGLPRGKRVLIRGIVARGPDGSERALNSPLEIIIN